MSAAAPDDVGPPPFASDAKALAACCTLAAAGLAHLSVTPAHFEEWWVFGLLFTVATALQLVLAVLLLRRPSRRTCLAAAGSSVALIAVWLASRTSGLPIGPEAGSAEPAGALDVLVVLDEAVLAALVGLAVLGSVTRLARTLVIGLEASGMALGAMLALAFVGGVGHG